MSITPNARNMTPPIELPPFADRFGFFDPLSPYVVTFGELPHWEQEGATYFITFRTSDSIPAAVLVLIRRQRSDWLRRHGIDPEHDNWSELLRHLPHEQQREFHREIATHFEAALDKGHGSCPLRDPIAAQKVADALLHFDGVHVAESRVAEPNVAEPNVAESLRDSVCDSAPSCGATRPQVRYYISDFVVMPNHVHVQVCFLPGTRLLNQCKSWKHYSAVQINQYLGRSGEFWQSESFDHLVRDPDHFDRFRKYIAENREKAGLKPGEGIHYQCAK
jgi:menaquinone-specific isochorismate synthase